MTFPKASTNSVVTGHESGATLLSQQTSCARGVSSVEDRFGFDVGTAAKIALFVILAGKIALLIALAVNSQYLMDEYAMARSALLVDDRPYVDIWPQRTLLYAYLYRLAFWLGSGSVEIMRIARIESLVVALASLVVLYHVARDIGRTRLEALVVLCVTLSFSSYIEWAYMVRPEPLALFFALVALWILVRNPSSGVTILLAGALSCAAFLATQKAVYFNVALGAALVSEALLRKAPLEAVRSGAWLLCGWIIVFALYVGFFAIDGADPVAVAERIFFGPPTRNAVQGHQIYINLWAFPLHSLIRNAPLYLVCLIGWLVVVVSFRQRPAADRIAAIFTAAIFIFVFVVHRAPWPYNFIMALPFVALWSPFFLVILQRCPRPIKVLTALTTVVVISTSFMRNVDYLEHDNGWQNSVAARAEKLLAPGDRYLDGVFMVVARDHAANMWLDRSVVVNILSSAADGNFDRIGRVLDQASKLWILNYRTAEIRQPLSAFLDNSYISIGGNIMLTGIALTGSAPREFRNWWPGEYRLYDPSGQPSADTLIVDGQPIDGPVLLDTGDHEIQVMQPASETRYLLPLGLALDADLSAPIAPRPLFPAAHSF